MNYTESLKEGCRATIKKLRYNYQALEYILKNQAFITTNIDKYGEASEYRVNVAKKFIEEHNTYHISDFITDAELESVLEEAETISAKLNGYFEGFTEPPALITEGIFQQCNHKNTSGRIYPKSLWKSYVNYYWGSGGSTSSSSSITPEEVKAKTRKLKTRWTMTEIPDIIRYKAYTKHEDTKRNPAMVHYQ
jgi:hypothetical protein